MYQRFAAGKFDAGQAQRLGLGDDPSKEVEIQERFRATVRAESWTDPAVAASKIAVVGEIKINLIQREIVGLIESQVTPRK